MSRRPTAEAVASVLEVGELADELLPNGAGASLTFVPPAWGVIAAEEEAAAELAASSACALMQSSLENWAAATAGSTSSAWVQRTTRHSPTRAAERSW